jgi:hypothetical protein
VLEGDCVDDWLGDWVLEGLGEGDCEDDWVGEEV